MCTLEFGEDLCATCQTSYCLVKCQFMDVESEAAHPQPELGSKVITFWG